MYSIFCQELKEQDFTSGSYIAIFVDQDNFYLVSLASVFLFVKWEVWARWINLWVWGILVFDNGL